MATTQEKTNEDQRRHSWCLLAGMTVYLPKRAAQEKPDRIIITVEIPE